LRVATKCDLPGFNLPRDGGGGSWHAVSSRTGEGLDALLEALESRARGGDETGDEAVAVTERQRAALERARARLDAALAHLAARPAVEILAFEVREACGAMRELLGEVTPDDVLHRLFAGFCIGK